MPQLTLACPICRTALVVIENTAECKTCQQIFARRDAIWRFLLPARADEHANFLREYQIVRADEQWGSADATYYRSLPYVNQRDPQRDIWRICARNFERLLAVHRRQPVIASSGC